MELFKCGFHRCSSRDRDDVTTHRGTEWGKAVETDSIVFGEDADRAHFVVHDDHGAVCPLVDDGHCVAHGVRGRQHKCGLVERVGAAHGLNDAGHDVTGHVLRQDRQSTTTGGDFGHAATGHGVHIGHHEWDGPGAVWSGQVNLEARFNLGVLRDQEDVAVREFVRGSISRKSHDVFLLVNQGNRKVPRQT